MSLVDEYSIRKLLAKAHFYAENVKENESYQALCNECIEQVHQTLSTNVRSSFINISYETFIQFAETTIQIKGQEHLAKYYLDLFFQRNTSRGQMYIRALLCYARVIAHQGQENQLKAEENINNLQKALGYVTNAIEIIARPENKQKYAFLIYNASVCVYHIIRPMFRPDWQKHFSVIIEKLVKLLEEVDEPDHSWLCRFTWMLFHCVYDSEKKPDALKIFEKLWDLTKKKGDCDFQDNLFRLRIHLAKDSSGLVNTVKKEAETAPIEKGWRQLVILQLIKSGLIPEAQVEKELTIMINSISPGILTGNDLSPGSTKRSPIIQERLAEAGRVALSFNLLNITEAISNYLNKVRQLSQKARIMLEYIKAEYLLKKPGPVVDPKTNMRLNSVQIKRQEIERRSEALRIMEKVMGTNKRVNDPELIYEGAIIIWNLSLPFLNANHKQLIYEPFVAACNLLEMIQSSNVQLRANFHLEIAKIEIEQGFFMKAEQNLNKGLALDYSIAINKIKEKPNPEEDLSLYQRPYDRYLKLLQDRVSLKQKIHAVPEGYIESVIMELETAASSKNENMRMEVLQKCLGTLVSNEEPEFYNDPAKEMVTEEVEAARIKHKQHNLYMYKQKKLLAGEVCKQAFDWELADIGIRAAEFVLADNWEPKNAAEMILNQAECSYIMALSFIDLLSKENFEIAFADPVRINAEDQDNNEEQEPLSPRKVDQVLQYKKDVVKYLIQGLKLAKSVGQSWLIFNGAIYIWNNYLPVFRNPSNDSKLLPEILNLLGEFFEALKNYNKELEKKYIPDYDLESKMLVYANIGIIYARLLESKSQYDEVVKACEALLLSPLNPHTRKLINSIKARTSGMAKTTGKPQAADKNKNQAAASQNNDQLLFDVVSQLEIIQNNTNKAATPDLIKKCYETLNTWKAKENDETELELHAELWARLAKLALNEQTTEMYKYALKSVEMSLFLLNANQDLSKIPVSRLRWYSLANYLYGETLSYMINPQTQEKESQEKLLFYALKHSEEAAHKGCKADINILVLDAAKQFWNICTRLKDSATNRKALIKPIFTMMYYLKTVKENTEPDLILLLNRLLTQAALENNEFELGESVTDMAFELVPKHLQRTLWESKMVFLSKQGKNELQAINNMKEADQNLQARLWIRLARTSVNTNKQYVAYQKAIDIFRKEESIEIADVLIEFSEWLLRNGYEYKMINDNLVEAANVLIDIEIEQKDEDDEEEGGDNARSSIYSKSSRRLSSVSKSVKSKHTVKSSAASKTKKTQEVKSTMSKGGGKSRLSVGSRLSRASLRGTTNMKAKVSKSFFAEREEEGNPEKLNVTHFDKLMRVYGMLAMLAKTSEEALQYCLDAKLFLLKIFELSYKTLNTMEQAAAKLSIINKDKDEKNVKGAAGQAADKQGEQNAAEDLKATLPQKPEEWINYQVPKEFIERIRTTENTNVMSKITFEKAELSYIYLDYIIKTLEGLGHHVHCLEIYSFLRFFVKEILNSPSQIVTLIECKYARFLFSLGLTAEGESIYKNLSFTKFFPNTIERKNILAKVEASVVGYRPKATAEGGEAISDKKANKKPNMVKEIHLHQVWIDLAQEFIYFGEINKARTLLDFAFDYARILNDIENLGFIEHLRAQVHYLEGKYSEALEDSMRGHRYPKVLGNWRQNVLGTYKILWKLEKEKDVDMMLGKVETVFLEMQGDKQFEGNERELNHNLLMMYLIRLLNGSKSMLKTKQPEKNLESMKEIFDKLPAEITKSGLLCEHIEMFQAIARKLNKYCENAPIRDDALVIHYNILEKIVEIATTFADQVEQLLKYSVRTSNLTSPLIVTNAYLKVLQAVSICNFGIVKNHLKYIKLHVRKAESRDKGTSPGRSPKRSAQEKSRTTLQQKKNLSASVDNFMRRLTLKVEAESQLTKQRFDSYEKASSILSSVVNSFPSHSHLKIVCKLALAKVKRLLAYYNKQMGKVWGISKSPEQMVYESDEEEPKKNEAFDYKSDALKGIMDLLTGEQPKMIELFFIPEYSLDFGLNFSQEMIENFGLMNPDITFEYLTRYQNAIHLKWLKRIMKNAASSTHRFFILERLSKFSYRSLRTENQSLTTVVLNEFKLADILYKNIEYRTIKTELLPNNSAYLILQMPPNELFLYIGFMHINQNREFKYHMQKYYFKEKDQAEIKDMIDSINSMKLELQRTPHTTAKDLADLEARYANRSKEIQQRLEDFCSFFMGSIDAIINPPVPETEPEPVPVDPKAKGGAATKDTAKDKNAGKKGAPGEVQAYQSNLTTPSSGIESLVLLLDERLTALPWEGLRAFKKVPVISRDFSMNIYAKRLRNIGFKPELNNSQGIAKDKMKYVVYEFKAPPEASNTQAGGVSGSQSGAPGSAASNVTGDLRAQQAQGQGQAVPNISEKVPEIAPLFKEIQKQNPTAGVKIEGVASSERIPSLGEWESYLRDGSMLMYFGNPSILNILTPKIMLDVLEVCNVKGYVVIDRVNSRKSTIEKFDALEPNPEKVFMHEQPLQTLALLTALGSSFVMMNNWPVKAEEDLKLLETFMKNANEGNYLARGLSQYKEPEVVYMDSTGKIVKKEEEKEDPKAVKKGGKEPPKKDAGKGKEEKVPTTGDGKTTDGEGEKKEEIKEVQIVKHGIYNDCFVYYGVPVVRLSS